MDNSNFNFTDMFSTIVFHGFELVVEYYEVEEEQDVGINAYVDCFKAWYNECEVTEIIDAFDGWSEINEVLYERSR